MAENVFLFIPNIVDYFRVVFAFASFYYMPSDPWLASVLYIVRSKLGAMLDQLIDRMTTMCLCAALCHFYPKYMLFFQASMAIDIVSHWFHLQSSLMTGKTSHKVLDLSANPVLRHYYHNKLILFIMCSANELFFCMLYLCYFTEGPTVLFGVGLCRLILYVCAPLSFIKTGISLVQLGAAMSNIATIDTEDRKNK
ncbi:CDIPT-like protein [Mya arenaria]|uniref:CDP-diacylglycerol--inositol 3-phosphatidyltransferase n=1 Tax=Mya arenaria TaxID=6604 RepID=A0ABY7E1I6_MYAAR|nr:CDIPT-like protein [Mya arenaria]